jgi:hypothetical protein
LPISVSSETHLDAIVLTSAFSNGSTNGDGEGVGRILALGGVTVGDAAGFWPIASAVENNSSETNVKASRTLILLFSVNYPCV